MPVVDNENRLVGIITVDDVLDIIEEEMTEDMDIMSAITPTVKPYKQLSVLEIEKQISMATNPTYLFNFHFIDSYVNYMKRLWKVCGSCSVFAYDYRYWW